MLNRRKKTVKFRGHHTHGYGSKKKHRGSGHQGGVGMAGTGKRADQKKPSVWKDTKYFGRHGFQPQTSSKGINIFYIEDHFNTLFEEGKIKKQSDLFIIDLKDFRADKLLGSGNPTRKYKIKCTTASSSALEKIKNAGGSVEVKPVVEKIAKK
ncbi:TPA: 50S ribosomal protein L15 [Candidatus Woesearchaeota archaeon]|nr:50S ribosomal protein L15P [uncultured archaeon]HIH31503.1 50S ribosomal protein L15 [Candidatus Woesearchaeota archaeon]